SVKASCFHSERFPSMTGGLSRRGTRISRTVEGWQPEYPQSHMIQLIVASDLRPPRVAALSATDPSPGLRPPSPQGMYKPGTWLTTFGDMADTSIRTWKSSLEDCHALERGIGHV